LVYNLAVFLAHPGFAQMRCFRHFAVSLAGSVLMAVSGAALADPTVIPGIGPQTSSGVPSAYSVPQTNAAAPAAGNLGGGFIELLVTGHDPTPGPSYNRPSPDHAYAPAQTGSMVARYDRDAQPHRTIDPIYRRQEVDYTGSEKPGTILVDTPNKFLFLVQRGGHALRYGIGVGRAGFAWSGIKSISRKAEWPDWTPPDEMLKRRPDLPTHMAGGPANPLGARALYLGSTLYRIHGTNEPYTIGTNVSSGCIRMMNEDVIDLYDRVGVGTKVIVM
jgi:lipoprotein-anchoring transpeptidase ErfK/SrfK